MSLYKDKYLKYKNKYLEIKQLIRTRQDGGMNILKGVATGLVDSIGHFIYKKKLPDDYFTNENNKHLNVANWDEEKKYTFITNLDRATDITSQDGKNIYIFIILLRFRPDVFIDPSSKEEHSNIKLILNLFDNKSISITDEYIKNTLGLIKYNSQYINDAKVTDFEQNIKHHTGITFVSVKLRDSTIWNCIELVTMNKLIPILRTCFSDLDKLTEFVKFCNSLTDNDFKKQCIHK